MADHEETPLEEMDASAKLDEVGTAAAAVPAAAITTPKAKATASIAPSTTKDTDTDSLAAERVKRIHRTPVPYGSLTDALVFTLFLVLYVVVTSVLPQNPHQFYMSDRIQAALLARDFEVVLDSTSTSTSNGISNARVQKQFRGILDHSEVFAFLQGPLLEAIFGTDNDATTNSTSTTTTDGWLVGNNRVLGGIRLRTIRVKPDSCDAAQSVPEYAALVPYCYGAYSPSIEQTAGYGPIANRADLIASIAYDYALQFFTAPAMQATDTARVYTDFQRCSTNCASTCSTHFSVEQWRYAEDCTTQCALHCKCLYEQPRGYESRCVDPNPNGASAALPTPAYAFTWSDLAMTQAGNIRGAIATYAGSGYVVDLPLNRSLAMDRLATIKQQRYLDLATRALIVDLTVVNAEFAFLAVVQLVVEFPATGGVLVSSRDDVLDVFRYGWRGSDAVRIALELVVVGIVLVRWLLLLVRWLRVGVRQFVVVSWWHVLDLAHLSMFLGVIAMRLVLIDAVYGTLSGKKAAALATTISTTSSSEGAIPMLHALVWRVQLDTRLQSINAALMWLRWLQYAQISPRMTLLLATLRRAASDLAWFAVYVLVCLCAFAQIALLLFGTHMAEFCTLGVSIVTLLEAIGGRLPLREMQHAHHVLGPLFFVAFYLLLLLVLLNVFLAILSDAYTQTQREFEDQQAEQDREDEDADAEDDDLDRDAAAAIDSDSIQRHQELRLQRRQQRQLERLRRFPLSNGLGTALRLLWLDLQRVASECCGSWLRHQQRVDPMPMPISISTPLPPMRVASRKLARQVQQQLETRWQQVETQREHAQSEQQQHERARHEQQQRAVIARLETLAESSHSKTRRLDQLESLLGSIETLCQELVTAAREDLPSPPQRAITTAAAASSMARRSITRTPSGSQRGGALAAALQRQKEARGGSTSKSTSGEEIEEIAL